MLINYVAPEVIGFTPAVNEFIANYVKEDPKRLIPCGSVHPRHTQMCLPTWSRSSGWASS